MMNTSINSMISTNQQTDGKMTSMAEKILPIAM